MVNVSSSKRLSILAVVAIANCRHVGVLCFAVGASDSLLTRRHSHSSLQRTVSNVKVRSRTARLLSSASGSSSSEFEDDDADETLRGGADNMVPTDVVAGAPLWPCGDALDQRLTKIALPCIANFAINPLVGAVDLFWVNRMVSLICINSRCMECHLLTQSQKLGKCACCCRSSCRQSSL